MVQETDTCRRVPAGRRNNSLPARIITDKEIWDAFVDESPSGLLFHRWDFLTITQRHTGYNVLPYGIYKGEELAAVCPLFCRQANGISIVLSPPPLQAAIPYLGLITGRDYATAKQSKKESILQLISSGLGEAIGDLAPNYLSITFVPGFHDMRRFIWDGYQTRINYSYAIDLAPPIETLWGNLNAKLRTSLRRFEKDGYHLEEGEDLALFYGDGTSAVQSAEMNIPMITGISLRTSSGIPRSRSCLSPLRSRWGSKGRRHDPGVQAIPPLGRRAEDRRHLGKRVPPVVPAPDAKEKGFPEFENTGANNPNLNMHKAK
jgi:hypothetical protein